MSIARQALAQAACALPAGMGFANWLSLCQVQCCATDDVGHALLVCTFFVVLLTVLFNGGASPWMMRVLALRAEDEDRQACPPSARPMIFEQACLKSNAGAGAKCRLLMYTQNDPRW